LLLLLAAPAAYADLSLGALAGDWRGEGRYSRDGQTGTLRCRVSFDALDPDLVEMAGRCAAAAGAQDFSIALERGADGLGVYVMAELPSNVVEAREFARRFDGFSIGSNDLTQLVLGVDRDSDRLARLFDERQPAVTRTIGQMIAAAREHGRRIGLCGQAPSDHPEFARLLVEAGIDSISVNPDSFMAVKEHVAAAERGDAAGDR
ncbi:MAG: putative PEP-binding protein, partial [Halofilum sp. (in: g-proteobacteria)]